MYTHRNNLNLSFVIDNLKFYTSNIIFKQFKDTIPRHSHSKNSYEIHYISSGYGQAFINNKEYSIVPNTLFITGPFIEHEQIPSSSDPMFEYCVYLKAERINSSNSSQLIRTFEKTPFWFGQDTQNIHFLMKQLFTELEHTFSGYSIMAETLLQQLIVKMVRNYENKKETIESAGFSNLSDDKYFIIEECFLYEYQNITLDRLASQLGLGIRQTERLLKEHYGKTFLQKRSEAKMSAAASFLRNTKKSITEISEKAGYSSVEHFSAAFKRYYGQSASEYRKKWRVLGL